MIYIRPIGGLGNMLFHIASIWTLAKDNDDELCLIDVDKKINNLINDNRCNWRHANDYKYIFNRFKNTVEYPELSIKYKFEYETLKYMYGYEYIGYFQSEKYFINRRDEILKLFEPDCKFNNNINKYSNLFENISLHVRRGDYVKLYSRIHPPQSVKYYYEALDVLPKNLKVLVFSDDLEWCRCNFIGDRFIFINEIDYISLYIMSKMKYHIISNSTFSWWGAWLSQNENKIVIAPKKWFGENAKYKSDSIIPHNWLKL
jgi:hypothetical protein